MKKLVSGLAVGCVLAFAGTANAALVTVTDPTPNGAFTGQYACYAYESSGDGQGDYQADGTFVGGNQGTHDRVDATCTQEGYVSVGPEGVVACNGNSSYENPRDGSPLVGYVWVGSGNQASNPTGAAPGGHAGAGNNHEDADGEPTGESPCP